MKAKASGSCHFARPEDRCSRRSPGETPAPSANATQASGRSPHFSSGMAMTAASTTPG
jgi:hypothetical protein